MEIKIDDIISFVATIRHESLSKAAEALGLTQPAVTRRVQNLEEALSHTLLDRVTKPPRPTSIGLRVYEQCLSILREVDTLQAMVEEDGAPTGAVRLGLPQSLAEQDIASLLNQLTEHYPGLVPSLSTDWSQQLLQQVEHGRLDAAIALFPSGKTFPDRVVASKQLDIDVVIVAPHTGWSQKRYQLADLQPYQWILNPMGCGLRAHLSNLLTAQGQPLKVGLEAFGTTLQLNMVASGAGLGLLPRQLLEQHPARQQVQILNVTDFDYRIALWLLHGVAPGNLQRPILSFATQMTTLLLPG